MLVYQRVRHFGLQTLSKLRNLDAFEVSKFRASITSLVQPRVGHGRLQFGAAPKLASEWELCHDQSGRRI